MLAVKVFLAAILIGLTTGSVSITCKPPKLVHAFSTFNQTFSTKLTSTATLKNIIVSFEVRNADGEKVYVSAKQGITLSAGVNTTISGNWPIPDAQKGGRYSVSILVFGSA